MAWFTNTKPTFVKRSELFLSRLSEFWEGFFELCIAFVYVLNCFYLVIVNRVGIC